jgi:hypothetical protein
MRTSKRRHIISQSRCGQEPVREDASASRAEPERHRDEQVVG